MTQSDIFEIFADEYHEKLLREKLENANIHTDRFEHVISVMENIHGKKASKKVVKTLSK